MIFQHDNYKEYLREWIEARPGKGRGEIAKMGEFLNVSPSLISAILNSERHFSAEQACELVEYLHLDKLAGDYLVALISYEKAGSAKLKKFWAQQKRELLARSKEVKSRIEFEKSLEGESLVQYYSHTVYSQIRVLSTLEKGISKSELVQLIRLPEEKLQEVLEFLLTAGLIREHEGIYFATEKVVHLNKESTHYLRHHMNWRLQQLQQVTASEPDDVTYTFPCTLSEQDFFKIRKLLVDAIAESHKIVRESPAEGMACLTIDFISYFKKP